MNKELSAVQALQYGYQSLTDEQKALLNNESPVKILQSTLGLPKEFNSMRLVTAYYSDDYARLLSEWDVALAGVDADNSPQEVIDVMEQLALEIASHPLVLQHTPGLTFNHETREWVKDDMYYRVVGMNKDLYMQQIK